ncbi:acyl-CoA dehydrogenase family protein [Nocardia salmonicida]|uniref:acyl-CoA dehydrogenase family protein n=1 Tax=Nocardia salmonicida TaxID=53431 RepID=UPI003641006B
MTATVFDRALFLASLESATADIATLAADHEARGTFPVELFGAVMGSGIARLVVAPPESVRAPIALFCRGIEIVSARWLALSESVHLQTLVAATVAAHANSAVREAVLPGLLSGELVGANCVSESLAGSDMSAIAVTARRDGENFRLSGTKTWVGHGPLADVFIVYARTSGTGLGGISCFLVDRATPGLEVAPALTKTSAAALPTADVTFDDAVVSGDRLLGRLHRGALVAETMFTQGRVGLAACAVGLADAAVERATAYAKARVQFGVPIIRHQGVSFLLADMATSAAAARALLDRACAELDQSGPDAALLAAQAKLFATESAMRITADAVQILGAAAYRPEESAERWMREAKLLQIIQGTNQIQRQAIAARL